MDGRDGRYGSDGSDGRDGSALLLFGILKVHIKKKKGFDQLRGERTLFKPLKGSIIAILKKNVIQKCERLRSTRSEVRA